MVRHEHACEFWKVPLRARTQNLGAHAVHDAGFVENLLAFVAATGHEIPMLSDVAEVRESWRPAMTPAAMRARLMPERGTKVLTRN